MVQFPHCDSFSLISLAVNIDRGIRERRLDREPGLCNSREVSTSGGLESKPLRLSKAKKDIRRLLGLGLYCGNKGHFDQKCTLKSENF